MKYDPESQVEYEYLRERLAEISPALADISPGGVISQLAQKLEVPEERLVRAIDYEVKRAEKKKARKDWYISGVISKFLFYNGDSSGDGDIDVGVPELNERIQKFRQRIFPTVFFVNLVTWVTLYLLIVLLTKNTFWINILVVLVGFLEIISALREVSGPVSGLVKHIAISILNSKEVR